MGPVVASEAEFLYGGRIGVAATLIFLAGVAGTVLALYGVWRLVRDPQLRFLGVTAVVLYVFLVVTIGRPYYLGGIYGLLAAAGALGLQRRREAGRRRWRWVVWPAFVASAAAAAFMLSTAMTITAASGGAGVSIAGGAAERFRALPPDEQQRTALVGGSYIVAAYLDGYSSEYGLPPAYSSNRGYGYFPPPPESQDAAMYIGGDPAELRPFFTDVRLVADGGPDASTWLLTGRTTPWTEIWPQIRRLTVA